MEAFYTEKNINNLVDALITHLNLPKNDIAIQQKCNILIRKFMQNSLEKYKKSKDMPFEVYFKSLNKKCLINCINFYNVRKQKKVESALIKGMR